MCLKRATEIEEALTSIVHASVEELVVLKVHAGDDEFEDAAANLEQLRMNLEQLGAKLAELEEAANE